MKKVILLLVRNVTISGITAVTKLSSLRAADSAPPRFATNIPPGFRDLRLISVFYEAGSLDSMSAVSGNEAAITPILRKGFHIRGAGGFATFIDGRPAAQAPLSTAAPATIRSRLVTSSFRLTPHRHRQPVADAHQSNSGVVWFAGLAATYIPGRQGLF